MFSYPKPRFGDSLHGYEPKAMEKLHELLAKTTIDVKKLTWIKAELPKQGSGTNDCGPYSACLTLVYLHHLEQMKLLTPGDGETKHEWVAKVVFELPEGVSSTEYGQHSRRCLLHSMRHCSIDWNSAIFQAKVKFI